MRVFSRCVRKLRGNGIGEQVRILLEVNSESCPLEFSGTVGSWRVYYRSNAGTWSAVVVINNGQSLKEMLSMPPTIDGTCNKVQEDSITFGLKRILRVIHIAESRAIVLT
jgi:hypothetical protein